MRGRRTFKLLKSVQIDTRTFYDDVDSEIGWVGWLEYGGGVELCVS
jgi:hypothetical protein